ncbi:putative toxin-antitoxin system toxin component, PIN family [Dactylococcopsis salina]
MQEYQKVLNRKKLKIDQKRRSHFLYLVQQLTTLVEVNIEVNFPRDQKDAKFLACAIASQADFLITGDHDFGEVIDLGKTKICSVSQFLPLVQPQG